MSVIDAEITPSVFKRDTRTDPVGETVVSRALFGTKALYRNYLRVSGECVNYIALQLRSEFTEVLMIPLRNLFITVAWTAPN